MSDPRAKAVRDYVLSKMGGAAPSWLVNHPEWLIEAIDAADEAAGFVRMHEDNVPCERDFDHDY